MSGRQTAGMMSGFFFFFLQGLGEQFGSSLGDDVWMMSHCPGVPPPPQYYSGFPAGPSAANCGAVLVLYRTGIYGKVYTESLLGLKMMRG